MVNVIIILRTNTHTHIDINQLKWTCEMIHNMCEIWISIRFIGNDDDDDDVYPSIYSSILLLMFCLHSGWMSMLFFFSSFPWFGFQIRQFVYVWYVCVWQKSKLKKKWKKKSSHTFIDRVSTNRIINLLRFANTLIYKHKFFQLHKKNICRVLVNIYIYRDSYRTCWIDHSSSSLG